MFLTLLTLIAIFLIDSTLGKAFDSQRNNKEIFEMTREGSNVQRKCFGTIMPTFAQIL
jgi:hypothetical protein